MSCDIEMLTPNIKDMLLLSLPLLPLAAAGLITLFFFPAKRASFSGTLATGAVFLSFLVAVLLFHSGDYHGAGHSLPLYQWFSSGGIEVVLGFRYDALSAVMTLVVSGVGALIHLYAIGYMAHDDSRPRFFVYLNLFVFFMLLLVLSDNLLLLFVGWEGVGLCSYLLIGFWYKEMSNALAGQKAFIVNRIGDAAFLLGLFALLHFTTTLDIAALPAALRQVPPMWLELIALFLFIGAMGKSAQVPLYVWLPDAMAGPTPVSALIHAATMVTAGVYMITRLEFLYQAAPLVSALILALATVTALLAASIALVQNDIKKLLAYSTISQLGYMFMALGVGAFSSGIYHLVTHAFFKAALFLAAGSVILGCHHEQDMRRFGGLWRIMPWTFLSYLAATLAIAGFPCLSGFYSKDQILWALSSDQGRATKIMLTGALSLSQLCWALAMFTAFLTAFYMTRSLLLTFFGSYRGEKMAKEAGLLMSLPVFLLAVCSIGFGVIYGEELLELLRAWSRSDMLGGHTQLVKNPAYHVLEKLSVLISFFGIFLAVLCYRVLPWIPEYFAHKLPELYRALEHKWWIDELYEKLLLKPLHALAQFFFVAIDGLVIESLVNGSAKFTQANAELLRGVQSGKVGIYLICVFIGVLLLLGYFLLQAG